VTPARDALGQSVGADEPDRVRQLRGALLAIAGTIGDNAGARAVAREVLGAENPDAELYSAAVRIVAHSGNDDDFDEFTHRFNTADSPQDEIRYLYSLPAFPGAEHLDRVAIMALDGSIRSQNAPFVLAQALSHKEHGPAIWHVVQHNWDKLNAMFPANTIVRMLHGVRALSDRETSAAVIDFFADRTLPQGQQQLEQHLERLRVNRDFRIQVEDALSDALN
jgi:puromycin-sensitive aminopeptidase